MVALYADVQALLLPRPSMALERLGLSVEMEGHRPCAKKQQNPVPGARIELATPAFSGRRSTNELPRHWCLEIVGVMRSRVNSAKKQVVGQPDQELVTRPPSGRQYLVE